MKNIILTADRPTGQLHIGHYVGSLLNRLKMQNEGNYEKMYVMIADSQALTDNYGNVQKVRDNILEVALDYLAVGIDPSKVTIFIQSMVPELTEFMFYYMNLVTLSRLERNPTVKTEIAQKNFGESVPAGFLCYPISQAADITAFNANLIPVGDDQRPLVEQTREIVRSFNNLYGQTLVEPKEVLPDNEACLRLPGLDGKAKMSKSLGNCIFLADEPEVIKQKVMSMYTDPDHIKITDPGKIKGNAVFSYLDALCTDQHFEKYLPEYKNLQELKDHYTRGGLGDVKIKRFLNEILQEILAPIREKRKELAKDPKKIFNMLFAGSKEAREVAGENLTKLKQAMGIDYQNMQ
ncbi:MAG: tryptophan--tRNA ligase [Clostridiales bacterium]|nr:tryptophan--tRNA ligase [Clostridiales bacterium]